VTVFYHTSEHDRDAPQRSVSTSVTLAEATNDTLVLVKAATGGARKVWRDGYRYSKAGLITVDLVPLAASQRALPGMDLGDRETSASLMAALDSCNRRFGRGTVVPGAAGFAPRRAWSTKFEMRSPRYTTRLDELPVIRAA
jgi:DNA polymerase V